MSESKLPEFEFPPVSETVFGVEFGGATKWGVPFYGDYWHLIRNEYPKIDVQPPLPSQIEQFGRNRLPSFQIEFTTVPDARCWFSEEGGSHLIQVQKNRFLVNWRRQPDCGAYPGYPSVRRRFATEWARFQMYLADQETAADVQQCELTYVNQIEKGKGWDRPADIPGVCPVWRGPAASVSLEEPEFVSFETRFLMPNDAGRLYVRFQPAVRMPEGTEIVQLSLTARGVPKDRSDAAIEAWFDAAHELIVHTFERFTSPKMHAVWGRRGGA